METRIKGKNVRVMMPSEDVERIKALVPTHSMSAFMRMATQACLNQIESTLSVPHHESH